MINEFIFFVHSVFISISALVFFALGSSALVTFIAIQCVLANIFVLKQTTLFGLNATCSDAFTIGAVLGLNLLQEYWGKEITKRAILINIVTLIFYTVVSQIHLLYIASPFDTMQSTYLTLFSTTPRIVIASISVYYISQTADYYLYGFLKTWWHKKFLVIRTYVSTAISQALDTILFSFLGLYGIVDNIWEIILISYVIKLVAILISGPFIAFSRKIKVSGV